MLCFSRGQDGNMAVVMSFLLYFFIQYNIKNTKSLGPWQNKTLFIIRFVTVCFQKYAGLSKFMKLIHVVVALSISLISAYIRTRWSVTIDDLLSIHYSITEFCWFQTNTVTGMSLIKINKKKILFDCIKWYNMDTLKYNCFSSFYLLVYCHFRLKVYVPELCGNL